jgi:hypothetical protein
MEGQVPVFISPRNRVAQLYPQALGSLYVASCDLQAYGQGILTFPQPGGPSPRAHIPQEQDGPVRIQKSSQSVLEPSPRGLRGAPSKRNLLCHHWEGCMRSMQCNVEFGYQLSICSGTKENLDRVGRSQDLPDAN